MKKIIALIGFVTGIVWPVFSQENTSFGVGAGASGDHNSYFGYQAGQQTGSGSSANTAVGHGAMRYGTNGFANTAIGQRALAYGGDACTAVGAGALRWNNGWDESNVGTANTAIGVSALENNHGGDDNTAVGAGALNVTYNGSSNTAIGTSSLINNVAGNYNTATGAQSLHGNNGTFNTANGYQSLYSNSTGETNTALGGNSMYANTTGYRNAATGFSSLYSNTTGYYNTALGSYAMYANTIGNFNMATGYYALSANTTGIRNSAGGFHSLDSNTTGSNNTATGTFSLTNITTGNYNSALGYSAGPTLGNLTNTTAIGYNAVPTASNQVRIGNGAVTSIGGQVSWTTFSDGRFKKEIKADVAGLEFIKQLKPVSYVIDKAEVNRFLHVSDSSNSQAETGNITVRQTGFVAQEVEALVKKSGYVFYGVDAPKNEQDHYGIRYAEFVVPLVKAVQELSTKLEEQEKHIELLLAQLDSKNGIGNKDASGNTSAFLVQNHPNPFSSETEIQMNLPDNVSNAIIIIYTLEGKQIKTIQVKDRGAVSVKISGNELSAGMYLYALIANGVVVDTKRMVLTQ